MNSRRLWNSHQRHTFGGGASWDILKIRVSEMTFPGLFKWYFLPWTPCCFVRLHTRLKTGNNAVEMSQAFHGIVRFGRFTDLNLNMRSKSFKTGKRMLYNTFHSVVLIFVGSYGRRR